MSIQTFRQHAIDQITWRLLRKAEESLAAMNYAEVIKIGSMQYPYNVSAVSVYYDMLKGDTYDRIASLHSVAVSGIPAKICAEAIISELRKLSRYYENKLAGLEYDPAKIKV